MKRYVLGAAISVLLVGCQSTGKGQKEFDVSQQLASSGNYAEAIAYLELALQKEPGNKNYEAQLSSMRTRASTSMADEAKRLISMDIVTISDIDQALSLLEEAKKFSPSLASLNTMTSEVADKRTSLLEQVREKYATALSAIDSEDWVSANFALQQVQSLYPNFESSVPLSSKVKTEGTRSYLLAAKKAYDSYDFEAATLSARKAMMLDKTNAIAKKLQGDAVKNNNKQFFKTLAAQAVSRQNWEQVLFACEKVFGFEADADCDGWAATAKANQVDRMIAEATRLLSEGYLARALNISVQIDEYLNGALTPRAVALRNGVIQRIEATAESHAERGYYGVAWYMYELLRELDPLMDGLFEKNRDVQDKITERVTKSIAVFDFKSPSYNQDAGVLIANKLIANLFNNASQDTNILERENLKSILEEMKLGQIGVVSEDTAKEMGRIYGIDVAIMGSVLMFKVDESGSESAQTVRYQIGEEIQDNIDFLNWKALNPKPSRAELAKAPQPKIMVPVYSEKEYTVTSAKKVGFIEISFRITDVGTGENTRVETITATEIEEDTGNEGVKDAGIEFDPLEVKTDTEMLQIMADKVVEELSRKVLQPLRNREIGYFEKGEELLLRRKEGLAAMEEFTNAVFDEKIKSNTNSPISAQVNKYMKQIIESHRFAD